MPKRHNPMKSDRLMLFAILTGYALLVLLCALYISLPVALGHAIFMVILLTVVA